MPLKIKPVVVTFPGVHRHARTESQHKFGAWLKARDPELEILHFVYGWLFAPFAWWMRLTSAFNMPSWMRRAHLKKAHDFILRVQRRYPDRPITIVAHSFGGWIAEQLFVKDRELELDGIIFIHCPISELIEESLFWNWLETGRLKKVFAWSSHNDKVIGHIALPPFGKNGYWGFIRKNVPRDKVRPATQPYENVPLYNEHTDEDHSGVIAGEKYYETLYQQIMFDFASDVLRMREGGEA